MAGWQKRLVLSFFFFSVICLFLGAKEVFAIPAIYDNPGQGIFQCHDNGSIGAEFIKGGGVVIRWDLLQPQNNDTLSQTELNRILGLIRDHKKSYLHFMIYFPNGVPGSVFPSWLVSQVGMVNNTVQPWDTVYHQKLARFLFLFNQALEGNGLLDQIEYIEPAAGGMWGTTHLWITQNELNAWVVAAGCGSVCDDSGSHDQECTCLGQKFTSGVNAVFDTYMTAFPKLPMMMIGGSCRYTKCNYSGFGSLLGKYGMRIMIKEAGLGSPYDGSCGLRPYLSSVCGGGVDKTKCGQETYGDSVPCGGVGFDPTKNCGYKKNYNDSLRTERISYYCMYARDISCTGVDVPSGERVIDINQWVAGLVGSQILIQNSQLSALEKRVSDPLTISVTWQNQGSAPLTAPLKQGVKWIPSSYKLFVEFVKDGLVKYYQEFSLSPASNTWLPYPSSTAATTANTFNIPASLGGSSADSRIIYKLFIGLTDPNGEKKRFALRNTDGKNDLINRRYLLADSFTVVGSGVTSTPTATRTPTPTQIPTPSSTPIPNVTITPTPTSKFSPTSTTTPVVTQTPTITSTPIVTSTPVPCSCPAGVPPKIKGNANCDEVIDIRDFALWRNERWGRTNTKNADFNCDNIVDIRDFQLWLNGKWGR